MSDVVAAVRVQGELLVCIDFDKPVWQNLKFDDLKSTPSLEHFMVDGILGSVSLDILGRYAIAHHFTEADFWGSDSAVEVARKAIYDATNLELEYIYFDVKDSLIVDDLTNFSSRVEFTKVDEDAFYEIIKPSR